MTHLLQVSHLVAMLGRVVIFSHLTKLEGHTLQKYILQLKKWFEASKQWFVFSNILYNIYIYILQRCLDSWRTQSFLKWKKKRLTVFYKIELFINDYY